VDRVRAAWERAAAWVRASPGTHILLLILVIITLLLRGLDGATATRVLRAQSTNLVRMATDAPRVLFLSAFLVGTGNVVWQLALCEAVMAPFERLVGSARWLAVFAAGHVGATMVTTLGIWWQVHSGSASRALVYPVDVGVSYGLAACAGALAVQLRRPLAIALTLVIVADVLTGLVLSGTFTDWGHAAALAIGFAMGPLLVRRPELAGVRHRAAAVVGVSLLVGAAVLALATAVAARDSSRTTPASIVQARVVGRPADCPSRCDRAVVRIGSGATPQLATVTVPPGTLVRRGELLPVQIDPANPDQPRVAAAARRTHVHGLFAAAAATSAVIGLALLGAARWAWRTPAEAASW